jgi:beta-carotene hydroxylase
MLPVSPAVFAYAVAVIVSSWFYPLFAVHLPHRHFGEDRISHAWTLRGQLIPRLFLPLAFHLEHHLYPMVPSHNLPLLAKRLEPYLRSRGVRLLHVP